MKIGHKLKILRNIKMMSLREVSFLVDIAYGYLSDLENNVRKNMTLSVLEKLAEFYHVDVSDLINENKKLIVKFVGEK